MSIELVLSSRGGSVVAPAGCGKTQLIVGAISVAIEKPILVLTHTTAGVAALKHRLGNMPSSRYRVSTIAGWALSLAKMFPSITGYSAPETGPPNYSALQQSVAALLGRGALKDILEANYSRVLVDEYQDCDMRQHNIVCALSNSLPVVVFGDPMQSIFDFSGPLPGWSETVLQFFPVIAELDLPWRWNNAGAPNLGTWILNARSTLLAGQQIDLASCPEHVTWVPASTDSRENFQNQVDAQYRVRQAMGEGERLLVIGSSTDASSRHNFARNARGLEVVEPVDLQDVVSSCRRIEQLTGAKLLAEISEIASQLMTGVEKASLRTRANSIASGRNRTPATPVENAAVNVIQHGGLQSAHTLLQLLSTKEGARVYRRDSFYALCESLQLAIISSDVSLLKAAATVRERRRHRGDRRVPTRAIGSTLLLKGLEAEHVVILNANQMNAHNLYVALSRGSKSVTVFSSSQYVG